MPEETIVRVPSMMHRAYSKAFDIVRPYDVMKARKAAREGRPGKLWGLLKFFDKLDTEIPSAMQSLTSAVTQEGIELNAPEDDDDAQRQKAFFERLFKDLDTSSLVEDLLKGHYYGIRAHQLVWETIEWEGQSYQAPVTYERLPMDWIYAKKESRDSEHSTLYIGDRPYYDYPDGAIALYTSDKLPSFTDIDFTEFGKGLAAARFGVFSWFNFEDWAAYNEAFATPSVIGTLLQGWDDDDKELLQQAVMGLTSDMRAIKTDKGEIEVVSHDGGSTVSTFDDLDKAAARYRSKMIKSESLTDNMGDTGSYAAMRTTNGIRLDVADGLATKIERILNRQIVYPVADINWGRRLVDVSIELEAVQDLVQQLKIDRGLNDMGVDLSARELRDRYKRSPPEDEDDRVTGNQQFDPFAQ